MSLSVTVSALQVTGHNEIFYSLCSLPKEEAFETLLPLQLRSQCNSLQYRVAKYSMLAVSLQMR